MTDTVTSLSDVIAKLGISSPDHEPEQAHDESQNRRKISAYDRMMLDFNNSRQGGMSEVDCEKCKNRGYIYYLNDDGFMVARECTCMPERRYIRMMEASGLGSLYKKYTFDAYMANTDFRKTCKVLAMRYAGDASNAWMIFSGQSGVGKTHLCTAICSSLAKRGRQILYVQWSRVLAKLQQTKFKEAEQDQHLDELLSADVLYIDDFLKTPNNAAPSEDALRYALEVINSRYVADKKTILSTEYMLQEILRFDEALGGRIAEKSAGMRIQVNRGENRNYRLQ